MFVEKVRPVTRPETLVLSISEANECPTSVNTNRIQETQREGKRQHLKTNRQRYKQRRRFTNSHKFVK